MRTLSIPFQERGPINYFFDKVNASCSTILGGVIGSLAGRVGLVTGLLLGASVDITRKIREHFQEIQLRKSIRAYCQERNIHICPLSQQPYNDPIALGCRHIFERACLRPYDFCPTCHRRITTYRKDTITLIYMTYNYFKSIKSLNNKTLENSLQRRLSKLAEMATTETSKERVMRLFDVLI